MVGTAEEEEEEEGEEGAEEEHEDDDWTWRDSEENWEYLGVGLRPFTEAMKEAWDELETIELETVPLHTYLNKIPDFMVQTYGLLALVISVISYWIGPPILSKWKEM